MIKICNMCHTPKSVKDFAFKNKAKGKYQSKCRKCFNLYERTRYSVNSTNDRKQSKDNYYKLKGTEKAKTYNQRKWEKIKNNPILYAKAQARWKLNYRVKAGEIYKPIMCGKEDCRAFAKEAHHYLGYNNWDKVTWYCRNDHKQLHRKIRQRAFETL